MRYFFVDRMVEMNLGKSAVAVKNVTATEDVFRDHFPGFPLYPAALLIETMAQVAGLLLEKTVQEKENRRVFPIVSIVRKAKFKDAVVPGDSLLVRVEVENITEDAAGVRAFIEADGKIKADAELFFTLLDVKKQFGVDRSDDVDKVQETVARLGELRRKQKAEG